MSIESTTRVWAHSRATGTALLVLLAIADHDGDGGAWPKISTLAHRARCSERSVQRHLDALVDLGELIVHRQEGGTAATPTHRRTNRYEIVNVHDVPARPTGDLEDAERGDTPVTPTPERGDTAVTRWGDTPVTRWGDTAVTPIENNPFEPPLRTTPPPPAAPSIPEHVVKVWQGEGINPDEQRALWALLVADVETAIPARRAVQAAWYLTALKTLRTAARAEARRADQAHRCGICGHGRSECERRAHISGHAYEEATS